MSIFELRNVPSTLFSCSLSIADKGIQHVSPFSFPWPLGSGFPSAFLSELKSSMNHHNHAAVSNERQRIMRWNTDDVANHVRAIGCTDQAKIFVEQVRRLWGPFFSNSRE